MAEQRRLTGFRRPNGPSAPETMSPSCRWTTSPTRPPKASPRWFRAPWRCRTRSAGCSSARTWSFTSAPSSGSARTPTSPPSSSSGSSRTGRTGRRGDREDRQARRGDLDRGARRPEGRRAAPHGRARGSSRRPASSSASLSTLGDHAQHQGRRVRHDHGAGSCRITAYLERQWVEAGGTMIFGETSELTGGEHLIAERCVDDRCASGSRSSTTATSR